MNNKGFAITSIIYGLMLLFVLVISSFLAVLVGKNRRMDSVIDGIRSSLNYSLIEVNEADFVNDAYITSKRTKYKFIKQNCTTYLPKNAVIITSELYSSNGGNKSSTSTLYYCVADDVDSCNSDNVSRYNGVECIN